MLNHLFSLLEDFLKKISVQGIKEKIGYQTRVILLIDCLKHRVLVSSLEAQALRSKSSLMLTVDSCLLRSI